MRALTEKELGFVAGGEVDDFRWAVEGNLSVNDIPQHIQPITDVSACTTTTNGWQVAEGASEVLGGSLLVATGIAALPNPLTRYVGGVSLAAGLIAVAVGVHNGSTARSTVCSK